MANNKRGLPQKPDDLPFDDREILRADDPRPQRVAQYPSSPGRRIPRKAEESIPTSIFDTQQHDEEMRASYDLAAVAGDGFKPTFLYVERGPGAGQLVQVKQGTLVVGRASVSDLRLQHPSISRRHAQLRREGEEFFLRDLGSQNGTFVNNQRARGEVEVLPGDEIAMGNALVRLRGPLRSGEALPEVLPEKKIKTDVVGRPARRRSERNTTVLKVAIFVGGIGFGLAAVLISFWALKGSMITEAPKKAVAAVAPVAPASIETKEPEVEVALAEASVTREKQIQAAIAHKMAEQKVAEKPAAPEKEAVAAAFTAPSKPEPVVAKPATQPASAVLKEPAKEPSLPKSRATILAAFEKGNAETSLQVAKSAGDKELTDKLQKFVTAFDAAGDAVTSNQGATAIKNFEVALKIEEELSHGWSKYGATIRKQLGNLYTLVGIAHLKSGNEKNARIAFNAALKNDPENERAQGQLSSLSADDGELKTTKSQPKAPLAPAKADPNKRNSIDDAFAE